MVDHERLIQVWKFELESRKLRGELDSHRQRIAKRASMIHQCKVRIAHGKSRIEEPDPSNAELGQRYREFAQTN